MDRYVGKVAIVTGGAGGIGSEISRRLAKEGAAVVVADLNLKDAKIVAAGIVKKGGRAIAVRCDILSEVDAKRCIAATVKQFGRLDILVNNAAVALKASLAECSVADWDREVDGTLKGAFIMSQAALPVMVRRKGSNIVNIGSVNGLKYYGNPVYSVGKAGLISLTQSIAVEYGPQGVRANMVSPGTVRTQTITWVLRLKKDPDIFKKLANWYPVGRVGTPEDIAAAVAFIASDEAGFVSGTNLVVDGALSAGVRPLFEQTSLERGAATPRGGKRKRART
jgi:NAD(P)-dependent dehydrogenase (short-subunit alcohol dehydrogenase family)